MIFHSNPYKPICGIFYKISVFLASTAWFSLVKEATPTLFLDEVIFDVIGGSPNVSTTPNLVI